MKITGRVRSSGHTLVINTDEPIDLKSGQYQIEIREQNQRTLQQNKLLWELISLICMYQDGNLEDKDKVYCTLLKSAGAKYDVFYMKQEALNEFKKRFRATQVLKEEMVKGVPYVTVVAFYGSSQFNKKEMNQLIDETLKYASNVGISANYWREEFERC